MAGNTCRKVWAWWGLLHKTLLLLTLLYERKTRPIPVPLAIKPEKIQNLFQDTHPAGRALGELPGWLQAAEVLWDGNPSSRADPCHKRHSFASLPHVKPAEEGKVFYQGK